MTKITAGVGIDRLHRVFVHVAEAHAIEEGRDAAREPRADAEIRIGRERRHDLLGVAARARLRGLARHLVGGRVVLDRAQHFGIEDQLIDQRLALGELERLDAQLEPRVEVVDRAVEAPAHEPAQGGQQDAVERRPDRKRADDQSQPKWQRDLRRHRPRHPPWRSVARCLEDVLEPAYRAVGWRGCTKPLNRSKPFQAGSTGSQPGCGA